MEFVLIATAHYLALLSPGPDFFLIMQASLRLPRRYGITICAGIAAANAVYLCCAVLGLEAVKNLNWLMTILKYLGALYLIYIGISLLLVTNRKIDQSAPDSFLLVPSIRHQFVIGFLSGILNPKNAIFYLSLFTVMVSGNTGMEMRIFYAIWMTGVVFFWDCFVVMILGKSQVKRLLGSGVYYVEKVSGLLLTIFGVFLPFT